MRITEIKQDGIKISQHNPDNVVIEIDGQTIILTDVNTELLRMMLYDAYRSKNWKSKKEKSTRNKALWALARVQGKKKPDALTEKAYNRLSQMVSETHTEDIELSDISFPDFDFPEIELPDFLKD